MFAKQVPCLALKLHNLPIFDKTYYKKIRINNFNLEKASEF